MLLRRKTIPKISSVGNIQTVDESFTCNFSGSIEIDSR